MSPSFLVGTSSKTPDSGWRTIGRAECKNKCPWNQNLKFNSMTKNIFWLQILCVTPKKCVNYNTETRQCMLGLLLSLSVLSATWLCKKSGIISLVNLGQSVGCGDWQLKVLQAVPIGSKKLDQISGNQYFHLSTVTFGKEVKNTQEELGIWSMDPVLFSTLSEMSRCFLLHRNIYAAQIGFGLKKVWVQNICLYFTYVCIVTKKIENHFFMIDKPSD